MSVVHGKNRNPNRNQTGDPKIACQAAWSFAHPTSSAKRGRIAPKIAIAIMTSLCHAGRPAVSTRRRDPRDRCGEPPFRGDTACRRASHRWWRAGGGCVRARGDCVGEILDQLPIGVLFALFALL